jgi:diaminopimelate decarboxylase
MPLRRRVPLPASTGPRQRGLLLYRLHEGVTTRTNAPKLAERIGATEPSPALDDCLSVRAGRLFVEGCAAGDLARRYGTPLYVVSEDQLRRNARRLRAAFAERWPEGEVRVLPSLKANFSLALRRVLTQEGVGCDTFGLAELQAALLADVPGEAISVNGSSKDERLVELAVAIGARIALDNLAELDVVRRAAARLGRRARLCVRVRPSYATLEQASELFKGRIPIAEAAQRYKPGIPTEELLAIGPDILGDDSLDLVGTMAHLGRHHTDLAVWRTMVSDYVAVLAALRDAWHGWEPPAIDLGGGFAPPRDPVGRARRGEGWRAAPIEAYAEVLTEALRTELEGHGLRARGVTLEVEPGRALYADAGVHLTTVRHVKSQSEPWARRWVETDTSEAFLPDVLIERARWCHLLADAADAAPSAVADIVGSSCGFDIIVPDAQLPPVGAGDVLAFLDTGAYQDAGASNFNALPRPATVLVTGDRSEVIKRAETIEDVFRRDTVPARLRAATEIDAASEPQVVVRLEDGVPGPVRGLDHVSLHTADLDRAVAFYESVLGLRCTGSGQLEPETVAAVTGGGGVPLRWADLELGDGRVLELLQYPPSAEGDASQAPAPGAGHLALRVVDADEAYRRLIVAGVRPHGSIVSIEEPGRWRGARCFYVSDPDGATLEIIEFPRGDDGALAD